MNKAEKIKKSLIKILTEYKPDKDPDKDTWYYGSRAPRLLHLLSYCKIKDKERHKLIDMINSSDQENYLVAEQIILAKVNGQTGNIQD